MHVCVFSWISHKSLKETKCVYILTTFKVSVSVTTLQLAIKVNVSAVVH